MATQQIYEAGKYHDYEQVGQMLHFASHHIVALLLLESVQTQYF